jgi:hypothetical protein
MFQFRNKQQDEINKTVSQTPNAASSIALLAPKEVTINGCRFLISRMPCMTAQEVIVRIPAGILPLINQYTISEEMVVKMLSCCQRMYDDKPNVPLISKEIINNHVPDFDTLLQLENECLKYNYDFFNQGKVLTFLAKALSHAESRLSGILTDLLDKLLQAEKPH